MTTISIVTGTHNRLKMLQDMIASVRAQIPPGIHYEFVVVDAGSTDGTLEWLRPQKDVVLIEDGERKGAIDAFTRGAYAARGKYAVLANDDIIFRDGSIMRALVHLEANPRCGAVAFADDRPSPGKRGHAVMKIWGQVGGRGQGVNYAQVGMFRKWLGDSLQWWKALGKMAAARAYGGDAALSALIWEHGYTVDEVEGAAIDDLVAEDDLRATGMRPYGERDGTLFQENWPNGAQVADTPVMDNPDQEQLRILYLPIYEPGHTLQRHTKRGLREALAKKYLVWELDYLASPDLRRDLFGALEIFRPHLLLTQLHGPDQITEQIASDLRAAYPRLVWVNWNGDYWPSGLTSPDMLRLLRRIDLQTVTNAIVLPTYKEHNITAAYWQIGYEDPIGPVPTVPAHEVVWLANRHSNRQTLYDLLTTLNVNVGIYGSGWPASNGECTYDFATGAALYQAAKLSIGDNQFPDAYGFVSNRIFQALAAGGALLLHQRVKGLEQLTGLIDGVHYVEWLDFDDLRDKIAYYLDPEHEDERDAIAAAGTAFVREKHSFDVRVQELFGKLLPAARANIGNTVKVVYIGNLTQVGARGPRTNRQYTFNRNEAVPVDKLDAQVLLQDSRNWVELKTWQEMS